MKTMSDYNLFTEGNSITITIPDDLLEMDARKICDRAIRKHMIQRDVSIALHTKQKANREKANK